jgi:vancomycin resistance protein YoaR
VYPHVFVGNYPVGGMTVDGVRNFVEDMNNRYAKEGIDIIVNTPISMAPAEEKAEPKKLKLNTVVAGDSTVEIIRLDAAGVAAAAGKVGRQGSFWLDIILPFLQLQNGPVQLKVPVVVNELALRDVLGGMLAPYEDQPHNAGINCSDGSRASCKVVAEKAGEIYTENATQGALIRTLSQLSFKPVEFFPEHFTPDIHEAEVTAILPKLDAIFNYGPIGLTYVDTQTKGRRDWQLNPSQFANWLEVRSDQDHNFIFSLSPEPAKAYLNGEVRPGIDVEALDAKFTMADNRVQEFQASRSGIGLNADKTYSDLDAAIRERNYNPQEPVKTVNVSVDIVEPKIKTADVNSLGITDVVGIGISTFKDSHTNRIKNIANAVKRLNGVLIKPGEEFSANKFAGPFIAENGFLPEMVIKGNEIKPEVGGGMCQIGTTLFRMAMNSGMDITQRRNHSLVVSYYADPVNGNPGTDATLYEPSLDLKFMNDTGNYLLLQTDIDYKRQQLTFTLWGKPDGRSGEYTHPLVSKWIPAGEPQTIVVTDGSLKPGEEKCQNAFRGAVASFTYTRTTTLGQRIERVFDSYYRPLPKICAVGATSSSTGSGLDLPLGEGGE